MPPLDGAGLQWPGLPACGVSHVLQYRLEQGWQPQDCRPLRDDARSLATSRPVELCAGVQRGVLREPQSCHARGRCDDLRHFLLRDGPQKSAGLAGSPARIAAGGVRHRRRLELMLCADAHIAALGVQSYLSAALAAAEIEPAARPVVLLRGLRPKTVADAAAEALYVDIGIRLRRELDAQIAADRGGLELPCRRERAAHLHITRDALDVGAGEVAEREHGIATDCLDLHVAVRAAHGHVATDGLDLQRMIVVGAHAHVAADGIDLQVAAGTATDVAAHRLQLLAAVDT